MQRGRRIRIQFINPVTATAKIEFCMMLYIIRKSQAIYNVSVYFFVILVLLECRYYERLYVAHAGYRVRQASLRVIGVATAAALDLFQYMSQYLQFAVSFSFLHCQNPTKVVLTLLAVSCFMVDLSSATTMLFLHSKI